MASLQRNACKLLTAFAIFALAVASGASAFAQAPKVAQPAAPAAKPASNATPAPADAQNVAQPSGPPINTKEIGNRLNRELGFDLQGMTAGWQHELDQVESALGRPRLRYSDLNQYRDELQHLRSQLDDVSGRLQPRLDADKAQMNLLGAAPGAGQPPEPEQAAISRAELNYHFGLLSAGQGAANSAGLRIDTLLNTIQDVRRKNFTSVLLQPIPGLYAYETWAKLPRDVPAATGKVHDLVANWWADLSDPENVEHIAVAALIAALVLGLLCARLVRRLRLQVSPDQGRF